MASSVVVRSQEGKRFAQIVETENHRIFADEPKSVGGSDLGPNPYDLLLAALGT
jgi:uncharacterized OsmC-like protein